MSSAFNRELCRDQNRTNEGEKQTTLPFAIFFDGPSTVTPSIDPFNRVIAFVEKYNVTRQFNAS